MSLSDAIRHVQEVADAEGLTLSRREERRRAIDYLNVINGHEPRTENHADPTGEKAVRRILATAA